MCMYVIECSIKKGITNEIHYHKEISHLQTKVHVEPNPDSLASPLFCGLHTFSPPKATQVLYHHPSPTTTTQQQLQHQNDYSQRLLKMLLIIFI